MVPKMQKGENNSFFTNHPNIMTKLKEFNSNISQFSSYDDALKSVTNILKEIYKTGSNDQSSNLIIH